MRSMKPDARVYLQHTYIVTQGVFIDEGIIFDHVTPEWIRFCTDKLGFEIPPDAG